MKEKEEKEERCTCLFFNTSTWEREREREREELNTVNNLKDYLVLHVCMCARVVSFL